MVALPTRICVASVLKEKTASDPKNGASPSTCTLHSDYRQYQEQFKEPAFCDFGTLFKNACIEIKAGWRKKSARIEIKAGKRIFESPNRLSPVL